MDRKLHIRRWIDSQTCAGFRRMFSFTEMLVVIISRNEFGKLRGSRGLNIGLYFRSHKSKPTPFLAWLNKKKKKHTNITLVTKNKIGMGLGSRVYFHGHCVIVDIRCIPYFGISSLERVKHNFLSNIFLFQHPGRSVGCSGDIGRILKLIAPCNNRSGANWVRSSAHLRPWRL